MRILRIKDGVDPTAEWFVAEGADVPTMHRSIPVRKAMDDAMTVLYHNGEALNPSNFPYVSTGAAAFTTYLAPLKRTRWFVCALTTN
jgi:hypothetical protein